MGDNLNQIVRGIFYVIFHSDSYRWTPTNRGICHSLSLTLAGGVISFVSHPCYSGYYIYTVPSMVQIGASYSAPALNSYAYIPLRRKTIRVGSWRWIRPSTPQFHVGYTNMLVSKNTKICVIPHAKHKICITPNAKPQCEPMENRLRWVPNAEISHMPCIFHVVCTHFILVGYPTRTQFAVEYGLKMLHA